jgi:hypothetical protein
MRTPLVVLICGLLAVRAGAQEIRGAVLDQVSGLPVAAAAVTLVGANERGLVQVLTDSAGTFALEADDAGSFLLKVRALGYRSLATKRVEVGYGELVVVALMLAVEAVPLDPLVVKARSHPPNPYLAGAGFYERRRLGGGAFLTREEIMRNRPDQLSDVIRSLPGIQAAPSGLPGRRSWSLNGRQSTRCQPTLVLDGLPTLVGGQVPLRSRDNPLDEAVTPRDIEGLEIYLGPAGVPTVFNVTNAACGAIVVWTRRK